MSASPPVVSPPTTTASPPISIQSPSKTITPTHFQHRTTNAAAVNTFIDTATPAINSTPVELDSTPVSPVSRSSGSWKSPLAGGGAAAAGGSKAGAGAPSHAAEQREHHVLGGIGKALAKTGLGEKVLASKAGEKLLGGEKSGLRPDDPAVMSAPPGTPGAEDFEVVERDGAKLSKEVD